MAVVKKTPIILLTGFLGSGKTSLLKRWLRDAEFAGAMVIVNEIGEVGLDHQLLAVGSAPLLLDNGCLCCALSGDLVSMLEDLFYQRLHRKIPAFSWVLIETTGLADPAPITDLLATGLVGERFELAAIVCAFDARQGIAALERHPEARRQVEDASVVAITKADLACAIEIAQAQEAVRRLNPSAAILTSMNANVSGAELIEAAFAAAPVVHGSPLRAASHSPDVTSAFVPLDAPVFTCALRDALTEVLATYGARMLRLKGFVQVRTLLDADDLQLALVQANAVDGVEINFPFPGLALQQRCGVTIIMQGAPAQDVAARLRAKLTSKELTYAPQK
jgi:G3E family GTPase